MKICGIVKYMSWHTYVAVSAMIDFLSLTFLQGHALQSSQRHRAIFVSMNHSGGAQTYVITSKH